MQIRETLDERLMNIPLYAEVLTERTDLLGLRDAQGVREWLEGKRRA